MVLGISLAIGTQSTYVALLTLVIIKILLMGSTHSNTKFSLLMCLTMRFVPALTFHFLPGGGSTDMKDVVCDGLFLTVCFFVD